jgi:uncharacterized protein YabE (DUF348 family)
MRMEFTSQRVFVIAAAGLLTASLAFVAVRHPHTPPPEVVTVDVQGLQHDLDDLNARIAKFVPSDDVQVRDEIRIARARLVELDAEMDEMRLRIAARQK